MPSALRQAAVVKLEFSNDSLALTELAGCAIVRVHSLWGTQEAELPKKVGDASGAEPGILCIRPGEWLFYSESGGVQDLLNRARAKTEAQNSVVDNLSDGFAVFRLEGKGSPWLLSKLSGLDFLAGRAAGQHLSLIHI